MSAIEHELIERISRLDEDKQRQVLEFVRNMEEETEKKYYTVEELMKLPLEERNRRVIEALDGSADEDFETFEASSEDDFDDSY